MLKRYWFYIVLLSTLVLQAQAQTTYPIQVNANLLPPYSAYLSDYYSGTREKLTLTLINRDQFKPTLNVRLRMIITAPGGLRLQTNEQAFIEPIIVENGPSVRLTQDDLAPYFQPQNLITQGYMASGKFPEGMVEFCFQAVEAYTGRPLSLSTCTRAWITSQKPPLLSLPRNNESIVFREPLNVLFQWTPLHQGLAQVEYEFILKELWDNGMTPQAAFPYAPEIYRETTRSTSLVYGAMQPPLLAGKRYAWCIRAQARDGMDAVNLFQNDGYSEIRWFTLQDNCLPPEFVLATAEKKRLNVEWTALPEHIGFSVSYRVIKARSSDGKVDASEWKEQQSQEPKVILYGLQSGGTYEYRVASYCMAGQPVYSPIFSITLPETDSARLAQCGIMPDVNLTNKEPIKELKTGEIIMANDYPVTVTKISGANGIYTGEGWTIVPWLNDAKIAVQFTSITVNTDKQMINGYIDAKYDKNEGQIANLDDVFEGGFDVGTVKTGITKVDHIVDFSIPGVEAFSLNEEGELVITDAEGEPHTVTPANNEGQGNEGNKVVVFPMTVQDKDGNVYQVEKVIEKDATGKEVEKAKATYVGKVGTPLAEGSFDPSQLNGDKAIVTFARGDGIYGFDTWLDYYDNVSLIEGKYQKLYTGYYAPWKLVPVGKTDKVQATIVITDKNIKPEQVIFKTPKGTEYKATYENGIYKLQLAAGPARDVQELYALYPNGKDKYYTLGKLNIVSYELQRQKVVLVPVNNVPVSKDAIQKALQDIYGPVGVTWDVVLDDNFDYTGNYRLMEKSTGLSTYNEDMRALNNAYKSVRADKFDKAANYLFFLKATGSEQVNDRDATGFMPRGSQFGYIFTSEIKDANEPVTVAHELGHGRWKLFHTFDAHYGGYKKGETENVMDYNNGLHVAKWQWDIMNDPAMLVSIFEGDDKSESDHVKLEKLLAWIRDNKGKKADFKKYDFYQTSAWVDVVQYADYEGEKVPLYVELGDDGKIDLTNDAHVYNRIGVSIDPKKTKHTGFYLEVYYADKSGTAIKVWAYAYKDFEKLLKKLGLKISEENYPYYIDLYKKAIASAGDDCDKLDVVFETIPPFATPKIGDATLLKALKSLSKCVMDNGGFGVDGTDEEMAAINILKGYSDKSDLYKKLYADPGLVKDLYFAFDGDEAVSFVNIIRELSDKYGTQTTTHFAYLGNVPPEIYEEKPLYRGMVFALIDGSGFTGNSLSISYVIGRPNWLPTNLGSVQAHKYYPIISKVNPLDPVRLHLENQEEAHIVPALYVYFHGTRNNRDYLLEAVGTSTNILGLSSSVRVLVTKGAPKILRALAVIELSKAAVDQVMKSESVKKSIKEAGGAWFVENWQWISISVDLTVFSADVLSNIVTSGRKASKALKEAGEKEASEAVEEIVEKADDAAEEIASEATEEVVERADDAVEEVAEKADDVVADAVDGASSMFKDLKLGQMIGEGGNKNVYDIVGHPDEVIAVLKKGKPVSAIDDEMKMIKQLSDNDLPVVQIIEKGNFEGQTALIMKKYAQGSKDVVKRVSDKMQIVGSSPLLNKKSIEDLNKIRRTLVNKKIKIDDLQFLIGKDGSIVIADPLKVNLGEIPSKWNLQMIDKLIEVATKNGI